MEVICLTGICEVDTIWLSCATSQEVSTSRDSIHVLLYGEKVVSGI